MSGTTQASAIVEDVPTIAAINQIQMFMKAKTVCQNNTENGCHPHIADGVLNWLDH